MKASYILYKTMTQEVREFLGDRLEIEHHQNSGCIGYFLKDGLESHFHMLHSNMYIIKDSIGTIVLSFDLPDNFTEDYIYKPNTATYVDQYNKYYLIENEITYYWDGYKWIECTVNMLLGRHLKTIKKG